MDIDPYVDEIRAQFGAAADTGGPEARDLAERLASSLDAAVRLAFHHVLAAAADEITVELAPGSVQLQLRGREPVFVVTPSTSDVPGDDAGGDGAEVWVGADTDAGTDDRSVARINVRMPESLKARVERAADREGLSTNAWLVRAAAARLDQRESGGRDPRATYGAQRYKGWAR